jgi:ADP-ribose pyrophosphatase YjhB (NUDIX family)
MPPLISHIYEGKSGVRAKIDYYQTDSFDDLNIEDVTQCYAVAFEGDKFIVVNNILKPGSYTLVGGSREDGETPEEAVRREMVEEANVRVVDIRPIGYQVVTELNSDKKYIQVRFFAIVERIGPFVSDPAGKVTEVILTDRENYKKYFDWKEVGQRVIDRAYELKDQFFGTE